MDLGISSGTFYPYLPTLKALEEIGNIRVQNVEIVLQGTDEHDLVFAHGLSQQCDRSGLYVRALHPRAELFRIEDYRPKTRFFNIIIKMANEIGAKILVLHGPSRCMGQTENQVIGKNLCEMADYARSLGLLLTLENTMEGFCRTPEEMLDVLALDRGSGLGFTLDLYKILQVGKSVEDFTRTLKGNICHFHFCDRAPGIEKRLLPGRGNLPLAKILVDVGQVLPYGCAMIEAQEIMDASLLQGIFAPLLFRSSE